MRDVQRRSKTPRGTDPRARILARPRSERRIRTPNIRAPNLSDSADDDASRRVLSNTSRRASAYSPHGILPTSVSSTSDDARDATPSFGVPATGGGSGSAAAAGPPRPISTWRTPRPPTPREMVEMLDARVVGQEHAKRILAVAVHNHYKRVWGDVEDSSKKRDAEDANANAERDRERERDRDPTLVFGGVDARARVRRRGKRSRVDRLVVDARRDR